MAVLEDAGARAALVQRLPEFDRLVLLGDLVELRAGSLRRALGVAVPVLKELGAALGPGREVVIVPGNHDHRLLGPWRERRANAASGPDLGLEHAVDWRQEEPLASLADALTPAQVRVSYPGLWLGPDVYAIHGHYLDLHITVPIMERLGAALMARLLRGPAFAPASVADYEAVLSPMYDWVDAVAEAGGGAGLGAQGRIWSGLQRPRGRRNWRQHSMAALIPLAVLAINRLGFGPVRADLSGSALRRGGLRAFDEVVERLGVQAASVIFGHTHRAGPLPGDHPAEWRARTGSAMLNTGSWVYASFFLGENPAASPYRPGFAYVVEDEGQPELVNLLDLAGWSSELRPARG